MINYNTLTDFELRKLCEIRKIDLKRTFARSGLIKLLTLKDKSVADKLVCGLCLEPCDELFDECGHVCHSECVVKDDEGFYICSICGEKVVMSRERMEKLYSIQEAKHAANPLY